LGRGEEEEEKSAREEGPFQEADRGGRRDFSSRTFKTIGWKPRYSAESSLASAFPEQCRGSHRKEVRRKGCAWPEG